MLNLKHTRIEGDCFGIRASAFVARRRRQQPILYDQNSLWRASQNRQRPIFIASTLLHQLFLTMTILSTYGKTLLCWSFLAYVVCAQPVSTTLERRRRLVAKNAFWTMPQVVNVETELEAKRYVTSSAGSSTAILESKASSHCLNY